MYDREVSNKAILIASVVIVLAAVGGYTISRSTHDKPANSSTASPNAEASNDENNLDLSGQQLTTIPDSALSRSSLTILNLSNNQLVTLPSSITKLANLELLNVENNRLESLPPEIGQLKNLKTADFSNNRLTSLPAELGNLKQLGQLNLSGYKGPSSDIDNLRAQLPDTDIKY